MACILNFVVRIQLKILHDIDKCVLLIVANFESFTTSHISMCIDNMTISLILIGIWVIHVYWHFTTM